MNISSGSAPTSAAHRGASDHARPSATTTRPLGPARRRLTRRADPPGSTATAAATTRRDPPVWTAVPSASRGQRAEDSPRVQRHGKYRSQTTLPACRGPAKMRPSLSAWVLTTRFFPFDSPALKMGAQAPGITALAAPIFIPTVKPRASCRTTRRLPPHASPDAPSRPATLAARAVRWRGNSGLARRRVPVNQSELHAGSSAASLAGLLQRWVTSRSSAPGLSLWDERPGRNEREGRRSRRWSPGS